MNIYHYLHDISIGNHPCIVRMITTNPSESVMERYSKSWEERYPVKGVHAINSGTWVFSLMEQTLIKGNKDFTVMVIRNADLAAVPTVDFDRLLDKSNFAFANATYTYFFRVDGEEGFGLSMLGITIDMAKKSAKRLQEVFRQAEMSLMLNDDEALSIAFPEVGGDELLYDGHSYIRKSFAIKMALGIDNAERRSNLINQIIRGELVEVTIRIMTPNGLLKGNATIVPNKQISADVVTHPCNIKNELLTEEYTFATAWEHHPVHMAVWDRQSEINFGHALPERAIIADTDRLIGSIRTEIKSGRLPSWLLMGEQAHDDSGTPDLEQLSETINRSWMRWQEAGFDVRAAQNLVYMGLGGIVKRMDRSPKVGGFHKKMWIPMTNAVLASVITWESATRLGGFTFPGRNKSTCFYDKRIGFVMPGRRFVQGAQYHGGWDQDDMVKVIRIKVWFSDPEILNLHLGKTIPATSVYASNQKDAREMVLLVRSPNGPGEWTIEECDTASLPIPTELKHEELIVVDICKMPLPSDVYAEDVEIAGMPESTVYSNDEMTRDDARAMIMAQMKNPGVGTFCNAMMIYSSIREGFPAHMLDYMENVVDTVQQGFDADAFDAIAAESENILEHVYGSELDRAIAMTRISNFKTRDKFIMTTGRYTRQQQKYVVAIKTIRDELQMHSLQMRGSQAIVQQIRAMTFGADKFNWAKVFYNEYHTRLARADAAFDAGRETHPFRKMIIQHNHKIAMEEIVKEMVALFEALDDESRNSHVLALWKYIVSPHNKAPLGLMDRIIFQPNAMGQKSVMDILITALKEVK